MKKKTRLAEIDILRGISISVVILIHTSYYFIHIPFVYHIWNFNQFAVPAFIFCSAVLFFTKETHMTLLSLSYIMKRFKRLLLPYYVFLLVFLPLVFIKEPKKFTPEYTVNSLTTWGGVDLSWLVFLFLCFTLLIPVLSYLAKRHALLFYGYTALAMLSSVIFLFVSLKLPFRATMWLPWSLILIFTYYYSGFKARTGFWIVSLIASFIVFVVSRFVLSEADHTLSFVNNKYPPNLYYISYGIFSILLILLIVKTRVFQALTKPLEFLSRASYSLFLIHFVFLYICVQFIGIQNFQWYSLFGVVFASSLLIQYLLNTFLVKRWKKASG